MYIPKHFVASDESKLISFMRKYSFATIVTSRNDIPQATHLPFVIEKREDKIILVSHFAKANDQWNDVEDKKVLVIFNEPHAYISPKFYEKQLNVPTWNYISVHAYGNCSIIKEQKASFELLEKMISAFEESYKDQWDTLPEDYKIKMLNGIVPFEIEVKELQGKNKLSQNKTAQEKQNIINAFEKSNDFNEREIGRLMKGE